MRFLDRILGRETRTATAKLSDPYLGEFFGQRGRYGGSVDPQQASGLSTAQACIGIISQGLASVPLNLYRKRENGGREKAQDHPLFAALHSIANPSMSAFEVRESLIATLLVSGNAYAHIEWNGRGQVIALHPLQPGWVTVERLESGRLRYKVSRPEGRTDTLLQEEMLHLRYRLAPDGVMGISPVQHARSTFSVALDQQEALGEQAARGNRPGGVLSFPEMLGVGGKEGAFAAMERKFEEQSGTRSRVMIMDGGAKFTPTNFTPRDAEFLESRKLSNEDICRVWNVPPTVAGILDHGTYSNVENESKMLVVRCLAPMAKRIEQAMNMALLTSMGRQRLFIEHDLAGLLRGDLAARYEAYRIGREWGWLSANEIRGLENLPEIEGGDVYQTPLNMTQSGDES